MLEVVKAEEKHIPEIVELWKEYIDFHKGFDHRLVLRKDAHLYWEKHLRELMKSGDNQVLVALDEGRVVGFSLAMIRKYPPAILERETDGFISDVAVKSSYRRRGIGEQMLAKITEWLKSRKIDIVMLGVDAGNPVGYPFWKKHGFKEYRYNLYLDLK